MDCAAHGTVHCELLPSPQCGRVRDAVPSNYYTMHNAQSAPYSPPHFHCGVCCWCDLSDMTHPASSLGLINLSPEEEGDTNSQKSVKKNDRGVASYGATGPGCVEVRKRPKRPLWLLFSIFTCSSWQRHPPRFTHLETIGVGWVGKGVRWSRGATSPGQLPPVVRGWFQRAPRLRVGSAGVAARRARRSDSRSGDDGLHWGRREMVGRPVLVVRPPRP